MSSPSWIRVWNQSFGAAIPQTSYAGWLRWLFSAFGLWLLAATRPLWLNSGQFPQVPWFAWGCYVPRQVDLCLLLVSGIALVGIGGTAAQSRINRFSLLSFAVAFTGVLLLDQHRFQPWAYQWLVMALVLAATPHELAIKLLRVLVVGIYVHSAVSKCDSSFCHGLGHDFLQQLLNPLLKQPQLQGMADGWALIFPLGELLLAAGLIWPRTRYASLWLATAMHLLLIGILGPWGLQHSAGVQIWNLFFILLNWILFSGGQYRSPSTPGEPVNVAQPSWAGRLAAILTVWVTVWPLLEPVGYCDLWPAWGLYAQHGEHLTVRVTTSAASRLPPIWIETAQKIDGKIAGREWCQIRPQKVSLRKTGAPLYPQNRYLLGVVLGLVRDAQIPPNEIMATWYAPANRWTGRSESSELSNLTELESAAARCWWNTRPRQ